MTDNIRSAVRALILDHDNHVLMVRLDFPHGTWWVLPGGGIESNEDEMAALHRELSEEVGLVDARIEGHLWRRTHLFAMTDTSGHKWDGQRENVYLVRTPRFVPSPHFNPVELSNENLTGHRWWSVEEIESHDVPGESFAPPEFGMILRSVIADGVPPRPLDLHHVD